MSTAGTITSPRALKRFHSWGRFPVGAPTAALSDANALSERPTKLILPFGNGRSYGDCCLNAGETILPMRTHNAVRSFDTTTGTLEIEAGATLQEILTFSVASGWFPAVSPGTMYVTVGGAIANDVHGKNHHSQGTFGCHVLSLELLRSDQGLVSCSATENPALFSATIAGLGLTGLIRSAKIQLQPVLGAAMNTEIIPFTSIEHFIELVAEQDQNYPYTAGWIDSTSRNYRGILFCASHSIERGNEHPAPRGTLLSIPPLPRCVFPITTKLFNTFYHTAQSIKRRRGREHYQSVLYPLDRVGSWHHLYGSRGFYQFQCVVPKAPLLRKIMDLCRQHAAASALTVIKVFGDRCSPGLISFPRPGITLCLDLPVNANTIKLYHTLEALVREAGGALYPAKDPLMTPATFKAGFPQWESFARLIDPAFSSSFWRRVQG